MKRIVLMIVVMAGTIMLTDAQNQEKEKCSGYVIAKMKREYLYNNLELKDNVREKFWSVYDKCMEEELNIHKNACMKMEEIGIKRVDGKYDFDAMNEEQILAFYDSHFQEKKEVQDLGYRFYNEAKNILHPKELVKYYTLDKNFKKTVAGQLHQKHEQKK
ncbi:MAG: hypothetical protein LBL18_04460 [Bacteroidales bacterium]|jgi:hypothetical protein|nr:hypothetical protein [Bacteroidales bacterium]